MYKGYTKGIQGYTGIYRVFSGHYKWSYLKYLPVAGCVSCGITIMALATKPQSSIIILAKFLLHVHLLFLCEIQLFS